VNARLAAALACTAAAIIVPLRAQDLPQGPGRDVVTARCVSCHQTDLIVQQRLSRAGWGRELDKMVRWGAQVDAAERESLLDYLAGRFAPVPAASHIVATAASEATYKRACLVCHEDDLIEAQRLTRDGWTREVDKMIRWGAAVPAAEKDALVEYLAARYPPR
jgi:mono/diheme cytochrome c family protein